MISRVEPEMESGYGPGIFGWMAPVDGDAHDTCRITGWCVRSDMYLADYPVEKEGGTKRNVALSLQKGPSLYFFGPEMHTAGPHSISVRLQKCSDGSRRGPLMDSMQVRSRLL